MGKPKTELLSPAGNWDCARAAVAGGADAIYFGLSAFNARLRADNFTEADLPDLEIPARMLLAKALHVRGEAAHAEQCLMRALARARRDG